MKQTTINTEFDNITHIQGLNINELKTVSFPKMLEILAPFVLVHLPEGTSENIDAKRRLDYLLGRCANMYAYLNTLGAYASYERARMKAMNDSGAEDMLKKKEALYELATAMKLKYEAVSRMLTVALKLDNETPDQPDYEGRRGRPTDTTNAPRKPTNSASPPSAWDGIK